AGELLELERELTQPGAAVRPAAAGQIERDGVAQEIEDVGVLALPALPRGRDRAIDHAAVTVVAAAGRHVGAIDRKLDDGELQRLAQALRRIVPRREMPR